MAITHVRTARDCYGGETPSQSGSRIAAVPAGSDLPVLDEREAEYILVMYRDRPVYVHRSDLDRPDRRPIDAPPPTSGAPSADGRNDRGSPLLEQQTITQRDIAREDTAPVVANEAEPSLSGPPLAPDPALRPHAQGTLCPHCGASCDPGARFCRNCRASLTALPTPQDLADFWIRLGAYVIDAVITTVASFVISVMLGNGDPSTLLYWLPSILSAAYYVIGYGLGATPGALVCGLRIVTEDGEEPGFGRGLVRFLVSIVSALLLGLGYFWAIWDVKKQTWHDKAAGTIVVVRR